MMNGFAYRCLIFTSICLGQDTPAWFMSPPQLDDYYIGVGIGFHSQEDMDSFASAQANATAVLSRQIHVKIMGGLAEVSSGEKSFARQYAREVIDSTVFHKVVAHAMPIDSFLTHKNAYVFMIINKDLSSISIDNIDQIKSTIEYAPKMKRRPLWTKRHPKRRGFVYGIGFGSAHRRLKDSWENSAKQARIEIAKQIETSVDVLFKNSTVNNSQGIQWIEETTNVVLNGATIKERWHDEEQNIFYTLMEYGNIK
jgi:hypothetical protein